MTTALIAILLTATPTDLHLDPNAKQSVSFELHHPFVTVTGRAATVEGAARVLPDGTTQVEVVAPVEAFHTGNAARDNDLDELLEVWRYPNVRVRALLPPSPEAKPGATITTDAKVRVDLHGRSLIFPAKVQVVYGVGGQARVVGSFAVDMTDYGIEPPSLVLVDAEKELPVAFDLTWTSDRMARR
jgi:polyisoprenoid-binding protein YceI